MEAPPWRQDLKSPARHPTTNDVPRVQQAWQSCGLHPQGSSHSLCTGRGPASPCRGCWHHPAPQPVVTLPWAPLVRRGVLAQPPAALGPMTEVGFTEGMFRACAQNPHKPTRLRVCTGGPRPTVMVAATQSDGALHPTGGAVMRSHFLCSACSSNTQSQDDPLKYFIQIKRQRIWSFRDSSIFTCSVEFK